MPSTRDRSMRPRASILSMPARAAAQPTGWPTKVLECQFFHPGCDLRSPAVAAPRRWCRSIRGLDRDILRQKIEHLSGEFELTGAGDLLVEQYSLGMKRKLAFCSALLHDPKVLVLDEPLNGLDPKAIRLTKDLFRQLAADGGTVILSTHLLDVAQQICDEVAIIHAGRLLVPPLKLQHLDTSLEDLFLKTTGATIAEGRE